MKENSYTRYVFDNGLTLYYAKNKVNNSTLVEVEFDCGSRCDGDIPGLSHFCEHMFFTGTKTKTKQEISKSYFDFIDVNAYTNTESIKFVAQIFTNELKDYLSLVVDMINNSTFKKSAVEEEKKVVIQEIVGRNDDYSRLSYLNFNHLLFGKKHYLDGVLGTVKSVSSITSKDVKNYVKKYFVSNNCNLYVISPLSFKQIKEIVKVNFASKLNPNPSFKALPFQADEMGDKSQFKLVKKDIDKNFLMIGFKVPCKLREVEKTEAVDMLCGILGDFSDGILKVMRLELGLVYSAGFYFDINSNSSSILFSTSLSKDNIKKTIDVLADYIQKIKTEGILPEQLEKEKRQRRFSIETRLNSPKLAKDVLKDYRKHEKFIEDKVLDDIQTNMELDAINDLVHSIFDEPTFVTLVYGNAQEEDVYSLKELKQKFCK